MRTVVLRRPGGPEVLELIELPVPTSASNHVLVRSCAMGVSRPDILIRKGVYSWMPPLPASPGNELTGIIAAVGDGVRDLQPGQPVLLSARDLAVRGGCYAEFVSVPADAVYPLPANVDLDQAVVLPTYLVAYAMLHDMGLRPGLSSVFVAGATGGVGGALVELAKAEGLTVIGSVGSEAKADHARALGADHVIDYRSGRLVEQVRDLTGGRGVDVVFDHVIAPDFADLLSLLADFGTLVFYNVHTPLPADDVFDRMRHVSTLSPTLRCFNIHTYDRHPAERQRLTRRVIGLLAERRIKPRVGRRLPMSEAAEAHKLLEAGSVVGKIILHP